MFSFIIYTIIWSADLLRTNLYCSACGQKSPRNPLLECRAPALSLAQKRPAGFPVRQKALHQRPEFLLVVGMHKMAVFMHDHIFHRRGGLQRQPGGQRDAFFRHVAHAPAAGHVPHAQLGRLAAQHPGKGRVHPPADRLEQRKALLLRGGWAVRLLSGGPGHLLLCGDHPAHPLGHKGIRLVGAHPQRHAHRHRAVPPHPQVQILHFFSNKFIFQPRHPANLACHLGFPPPGKVFRPFYCITTFCGLARQAIISHKFSPKSLGVLGPYRHRESIDFYYI